MAESDKNTDESSGNASASGGGASDATGSGDATGSTNNDTDNEAKKPSNSASTNNDAATQAEGQQKSLGDEPKVEVSTVKEKSLTTLFNEALTEAVNMGLAMFGQEALDNYATSVGNKKSRGETVNPVAEAKNVAGPMAAALVQFNLDSQLSTRVVASADHSFVGNGVAAKQQQASSQTVT